MNRLFFIGAGKMATAIAGGLVRSGTFDKTELQAYDITPQAAAKFTEATGVTCLSGELEEAPLQNAGAVLLAVKPQYLADALNGWKYILETKLIISIAAGILRKNQPTVQEHQALEKEVEVLSKTVAETKAQVSVLRHQEKRDVAISGNNETRYQVASQPNVTPSMRHDAVAVAQALRGDSHYTQLVARSKPDHLDDWEMLSEMEKDERLEEMESRKGW